MITLITGVPGAGKTLNTLKMVQEDWGESGRQICYRGIRDLNLDWREVTDDELRKWFDFEDGTIFVIDEVQQVFPRRSPNQSEPEAVARLDTHRHRGFDFYIITQKPKNFDFAIRGFVGRHLHFERGYGREATLRYEWQKACDDPDDYHRKQEAEKTRISFDKKYYDVYKSSEIHTHKKRTPRTFYYFLGALGFTFATAAYAYNSISEKREADHTDDQGEVISPFTPDQFGAIPSAPDLDATASLEKLQFLQQHTPRVEQMEWTAPVYDDVRQVKTFPRPQCMRSERTLDCKCFTQQATPMDIDAAMCNSIVDGGWFNPYLDEEQQRQAEASFSAPPPLPSGERSEQKPRIVYVGREGQDLAANIAVPPGLRTNQPGQAYRNPVGTAPTQPRQP